ncbi:hypothetical protein ACWEVD_11760 [Nocardia thailandica]|uniref:PE domain-containing protein n=1 Tax=Nocardia thailandica TaxID=257275 RepID=A0ABW6PT58_9NOCA
MAAPAHGEGGGAMLAVNPENLRLTMKTMWSLRDDVSDPATVPSLDAARARNAVAGSRIAAALADADGASAQAIRVVAARLHEYGQLLDAAATFYDGTDVAAAARIAAVTGLDQEPAR